MNAYSFVIKNNNIDQFTAIGILSKITRRIDRFTYTQGYLKFYTNGVPSNLEEVLEEYNITEENSELQMVDEYNALVEKIMEET